MTTEFERNFQESLASHTRLVYTPNLTIQHIVDAFFDGHSNLPEVVDEIKIEEGEKVAVVLLGESCVGKSTYGRRFIEEHPSFEYLSMDDCASRELSRKGNIQDMVNSMFGVNPDTVGFQEFGQKIDSASKLVIDGCWIYMNMRSALLKTLHSKGFKVIAVSFLNVSEQKRNEYIEARVLNGAARDILGKFSIDITNMHEDWIGMYAKKQRLTRKDAIKRIKNTETYRTSMRSERALIEKEQISSAIIGQVQNGTFYLWIDQVIFA